MVYLYVESLYTIAWAFCIVRLDSLGNAKAYVWGWTRGIPTHFREGLKNIQDIKPSALGNSTDYKIEKESSSV